VRECGSARVREYGSTEVCRQGVARGARPLRARTTRPPPPENPGGGCRWGKITAFRLAPRRPPPGRLHRPTSPETAGGGLLFGEIHDSSEKIDCARTGPRPRPLPARSSRRGENSIALRQAPRRSASPLPDSPSHRSTRQQQPPPAVLGGGGRGLRARRGRRGCNADRVEARHLSPCSSYPLPTSGPKSGARTRAGRQSPRKRLSPTGF
jgi:hypothetical protein